MKRPIRVAVWDCADDETLEDELSSFFKTDEDEDFEVVDIKYSTCLRPTTEEWKREFNEDFTIRHCALVMYKSSVKQKVNDDELDQI
jgi:hypothetical protein